MKLQTRTCSGLTKTHTLSTALQCAIKDLEGKTLRVNAYVATYSCLCMYSQRCAFLEHFWYNEQMFYSPKVFVILKNFI